MVGPNGTMKKGVASMIASNQIWQVVRPNPESLELFYSMPIGSLFRIEAIVPLGWPNEPYAARVLMFESIDGPNSMAWIPLSRIQKQCKLVYPIPDEWMTASEARWFSVGILLGIIIFPVIIVVLRNFST